MITLNSSIRLVIFQFIFSNPNVVPPLIKQLKKEKETLEEQKKRKARKAKGTMLIESPNCSFVGFFEELEKYGYKMVDTFYQPRIDPKDSHGKRIYHMVRSIFARHEYVELSDELMKVWNACNGIHAELQDLCTQAMWQIRIFLNPFFDNGEEIPGQHALNINIAARKPLFYPDGQPVTAWQKNKDGRRVGKTPLPIEPDNYLRINNGG